MLRICLLTLGSPEQLTGGYLYHRRLADLASQHDAVMEFASLPALPFPAPVLGAPRALARARRADVAVIDSIAAGFLAPQLLRDRGGPPLVGMLHQPPGGIDHGPLRRSAQAPLDRVVYRRCRRLLAASDALAETVGGIGPPVTVVAPGSDVASPPEGPAPELRRGRGAAVLAVGNWVRRKGILELLEAFEALPADVATLHLVGRRDVEPRYARRVRERLASPALAGRVVVHGPVPRSTVAGLYAGADVFALPSYVEPYGTVYGEALSAGLPVIGWRAGNLPHLADDGCEGLLVRPGDVPGLTAALLKAVRDEPLRSRLAEAARLRGARLPTWDDSAERFFAALRATA